MKVYSDFDHDISLSKYKTFGWPDNRKLEANNNPLYYNELNDKRIRNEVALQLKNKGYTYAELNPDLKMHYHIVVENWATINPDPFGYAYDSYWLNRNVNRYEYREGTLIIDLMDPKTNTLIWRGWAVNFNDEKRPDQMEHQIKEATQKIFQKFPIHK
jgi:hypothetical protein